MPDIYASTPLLKSNRSTILGLRITNDEFRAPESSRKEEQKIKPALQSSSFYSPNIHSSGIINPPMPSFARKSSLSFVATHGLMGQSDGKKKNKENEIDQKYKTSGDKISSAFDQVAGGKTITLDVSGVPLTETMIEGFSSKIKLIGQCKTLKMSGNGLKDNGLRKVLKLIEKLNIEFLFLTNNQLTESALEYLFSFTKYNNSLRNVYLNGNNISKLSSKTKDFVKALEAKNMIVTL